MKEKVIGVAALVISLATGVGVGYQTKPAETVKETVVVTAVPSPTVVNPTVALQPTNSASRSGAARNPSAKPTITSAPNR